MNIVNVTTKAVKITASEGCYLTRYTDEQDIITFSSCTKVTTLVSQVSKWREITSAQNDEYENRKAIAEAQQAEENPTEE